MTGVLETNIMSILRELSSDILKNLTLYMKEHGQPGIETDGFNFNTNATVGGLDNCYWFRFAFYTIVVGIVCILGVAGNTLSLMVLRRDRNNGVALFLLQALAVADNMLLLTSFVLLSVSYGLLPLFTDRATSSNVLAFMLKYGEPVAYMSHMATIWMTVLIASNRYVAVCKPFHASNLCTLVKARVQVLCVFAFSVLFNLPRFFQWNLTAEVNSSTGDIIWVPIPSHIGYHSLFEKVYTNALYSILVVILPLVALTIVNTKLIREIREMRDRRISLTSEKPGADDNVTTVMVIIILVVVVCNIPDRLLQVWRVSTDSRFRECARMPYYLLGVANLLIILNSSVNFLIYYIMRKRFRRMIRGTLCRSLLGERPLTPPKHSHDKLMMHKIKAPCNGEAKEEML